jgi:hypothetical protein
MSPRTGGKVLHTESFTRHDTWTRHTYILNTNTAQHIHHLWPIWECGSVRHCAQRKITDLYPHLAAALSPWLARSKNDNHFDGLANIGTTKYPFPACYSNLPVLPDAIRLQGLWEHGSELTCEEYEHCKIARLCCLCSRTIDHHPCANATSWSVSVM